MLDAGPGSLAARYGGAPIGILYSAQEFRDVLINFMRHAICCLIMQYVTPLAQRGIRNAQNAFYKISLASLLLNAFS